jgi:hypothetical protein
MGKAERSDGPQIINCYYDGETSGQGGANNDEFHYGVWGIETVDFAWNTDFHQDFNKYYWYLDGDYPALNWELSDTTGSSNYNPLVINSITDFVTIFSDQENWKETFKLTNDLDVSNLALTVIGTSETPFTGSFDGGDHVLKGINYTGYDDNANKESVYGFFGIVEGATIKRLGLVNPVLQFQLDASTAVQEDDKTGLTHKGWGLFANVVKDSSITQCFVKNGILNYNATNTYSGSKYDYEKYLGLFIGQISGSNVDRSYATGSLTVNSRITSAADLTSRAFQSGSGYSNNKYKGFSILLLPNKPSYPSYKSGRLMVLSDSGSNGGLPDVGGLIGYATDSAVLESYFGGKISELSGNTSRYCGTLVGLVENSGISNSVTAESGYPAVGSNSQGTDGVIVLARESIGKSSFKDMGWDFYSQKDSDFIGDWKMPDKLDEWGNWPLLVWE